MEEVTEVTYLAVKVAKDGNTETYIKTRKDQQGQGSICCSEEHLGDENDQQENKDMHVQDQRTEHTAI